MKATWLVAVVYEDAETREGAVACCDRLVERFWAGRELDLAWWPFEQLSAPDSAEEALDKAAAADVMIFAARPEGEMPVQIRAWTERWLSRRGAREGTLIGLLGPGAGQDTAEKHVYLRKVAHRGGMDYLTDVAQYIWQDMPESAEFYNERAECVTSVLNDILHQEQAPPHLSV